MTDFSSTPEEQKAAIDLIVGFIPYVETANDLLTVTTGCGIGCRMTGVEDTSADRRWAAVGIASPVGGRVLGVAAGGAGKAIHRMTGAEIANIARKDIKHGNEMGHLSGVSSDVLENAMTGFRHRNISTFNGDTYMLDADNMRFILSRHHPEYFEAAKGYFSGSRWAGIKQQNSGFDAHLTVNDVADLAEQVLTGGYRNRVKNGNSYSITHTIDGKTYHMAVDETTGRIVHFMPVP